MITPSGISNTITQNIGTSTANGFAKMKFSPDGNKMALLTLTGLFELYDFDRCTGLLSNPFTVFPEQSPPYSHYFWDGQFSPSGNIFYTTSSWDTSRFIKYDLQAANIPGSADTLWQTNTITNQFGQVKLAPDNKIYLTTWYNNGMQTNFPYADTMTNVFNSYLSVVNEPDSLGTACDFQPYSFYLGGKRTYLGLPNNPDYDLPALAGSPCDTLVSINEPASISSNATLHVYYAPGWEKAFINADKLKGKQYRLRLVDVLGKEVYAESGVLNSPYFTKDLNCASFTKGMYIVDFETDKEKLNKKFVIE
ncbi:MAG: T9SS type A sorting domain-containing protein [Bacteroidetes bacterium]|nr:T9SS type A sorting domain-containing protein [Bacteroidota bacterium]